ncbi:MAG: hypothetical protein A3B44_02390 [Candidatus Levybacteria bacterium RIFCSPLOWO2_01_FULL_38_21]|nr:MAG: hypothetical protein A3B44_02390 [Candidatus Levybacteria bacterium RIFCSPLOWO2_01_FULL_38_21]
MIWRYRITLFLLLAIFCLVIIRLFYWQIVKASDLSLLGQSQYGRLIKVLPERGQIKTSDNFPIVTNKISYLVFANPKEIKDKEKNSLILAQALGVSKASISAQLSLDRFWVPLKSQITIEDKEKISKLNLPGIGFEKQFTRYYPEASMAAHLLGFVGKDEAGQDKGYFGIEGYYDRLLKGKEDVAVQIHDALGRPILSRASKNSKEAKGDSLVLNINRSIQFMAEEKLKKGIERYQASGGSVGIMDPKTGNILALVSFPSFLPSDFQDYEANLFKNPFISSLYEPGSTFKPLVLSPALDSKLVTPETKCPICSGPVSISGFELHTWNNKYYKDTNMVEVIQHSDNIGMVFVAQKLGVDRMIDYLSRFGIGDVTGVDIQGEVSQSLLPKAFWYPVDLVTKGFGQGISVTPIELLSAFSAIANKGVRMEPHVVGKVETPDGKISKIPPKILGKPISEETAKIMTEILVNAVNKGEASWTRLRGYRIAGKTGTASIPVKGHYDPNQTITSFIGFAPSDNPKFVMLVILDRPTASIYGAETAAPIFFDIAKDVLAYYGIPQTE